MNKKFWIGFVVVFVAMQVTDFLIHCVLLMATYMAQTPGIFRPMTEINNMLLVIVSVITSFFLTMLYSKGHEGKGIGEGVRFGLYFGFVTATPMAYTTFAVQPITYSLAMQWFIYGMVQALILGILLSVVYGKKEVAA